jgi:hypothetical protein
MSMKFGMFWWLDLMYFSSIGADHRRASSGKLGVSFAGSSVPPDEMLRTIFERDGVRMQRRRLQRVLRLRRRSGSQ